MIKVKSHIKHIFKTVMRWVCTRYSILFKPICNNTMWHTSLWLYYSLLSFSFFFCEGSTRHALPYFFSHTLPLHKLKWMFTASCDSLFSYSLCFTIVIDIRAAPPLIQLCYIFIFWGSLKFVSLFLLSVPLLHPAFVSVTFTNVSYLLSCCHLMC